MPHPHTYVRIDSKIEAMQVNPSNKAGAIEKFCPSFRFESQLRWPTDSDVPVQTGEHFFSIQVNDSFRLFGNLWDWILKYDKTNSYRVVSNKDFVENYEHHEE